MFGRMEGNNEKPLAYFYRQEVAKLQGAMQISPEMLGLLVR